jgi:nucleoside-diphosphate-sugar epimerase
VRIAVTGASGKLGRHVVSRLNDAGHEVVALDRIGPRGSGVMVTDLTDFGQVVDAFSGGARGDHVDAVVHLGAIPAPGLVPDAATFANNMTATFNVLHAARQLGIFNIVIASSETVLGLPFDEAPPYLPIDEEYDARPESVYSLGKHLEEQLAIQLVRWDPSLSIAALRFSNVIDQEEYADFPAFDADPSLRKWNLWTYIDARDGALAVLRAVEAGVPGFNAYVIANTDSVMSRSTASLAAEVFPDVEVRKELGEHESLYSIEKARRLLGFEPKESWRNHV